MSLDIEEGIADLDDHDLELLKRIESDFDVGLKELERELDLSSSAIHYRLKKLRENGVIEGVTADLNPLSFGLNMVMITNVKVDHQSGYAEDIGTRLGEVPGVTQVYYTMGDVDFVLLVRVQNRDQMNEAIDEIVGIDGVNETSSRFVMQELKRGGRPLEALSDSMRENLSG
jgi:DNA-binding Lrp family transcriptional regulator